MNPINTDGRVNVRLGKFTLVGGKVNGLLDLALEAPDRSTQLDLGFWPDLESALQHVARRLRKDAGRRRRAADAAEKLLRDLKSGGGR